jgi:hypothetical protein
VNTKPNPAKLSEAQVTEQCIQWLRLKGWTCERVQSGLMNLPGNRRIRIGSKGVPDWNCFKGPLYFKLELKAPDGTLSSDQLAYFDMARTNKMPCIWADSLESLIARYELLWNDQPRLRVQLGAKG